jgi:hypothetical protein
MIFQISSKHQSEEDKLANSFPIALKQDVEKVLEILAFRDNFSLSENSITVSLKEEIIQFPYRIYFDEPIATKEDSLTTLQKTILDCIFLRHHNGFVRQRRLELLLDKTDFFIVPFVIQLLAEYVNSCSCG